MATERRRVVVRGLLKGLLNGLAALAWAGGVAPMAAASSGCDASPEDIRYMHTGAGVADAALAPPGLIDWVSVEGGTFMMGSDDGDRDEQPVHEVRVPTFELAKTEVTVGQYRVCVEAGACSALDAGSFCDWGESGRDEHPVNCVDWEQARRFSSWAGGRLPSEAEWEYAARSGGKDQAYPWGDEPATCGRAQSDDCDGVTQPVCSKPAGNSAQGICDLAGNVWEWVEDAYGSYDDAPTDGSARTRGGANRVYRGGGWNYVPRFLRAAHRDNLSPGGRSVSLGFRPAR